MKLQKLIPIILILFITTALNIQAKEIGKFLGAKDTTMPSWFLNSFLDIKEDITELSSNNKRLIIYFHQANCPYCHKFVNINLKDKKIKDKIQNNFAIVAINMFGDSEVTDVDGNTYSEKEFAKKYKVQFTPSLFFYNEDAKVILKLNGYIPKNSFIYALDYIKDKKENSLTYNQYLEKNLNRQKTAQINSLFMKSSKVLRRDLNNKAIAVFFESDSCITCQNLHNLYLEDPTIQKLLTNIDIAKVDINSKKSIATPDKIILKTQTWIKNLNITYNPSIIFFDEKGKEIIRVESELKKFHMQSIVDYVSSGAYKKEPEFQRYLTKRANDIRGKGIDVNIWEE